MAKALGDIGCDVVTATGDLSRAAAAAALIGACRDRFGRLDVLVNNAGGGVIRPTLEHTDETLNTTLDRNLWTALRTTLAALPGMRGAGYGRIVFVGADSVRNSRWVVPRRSRRSPPPSPTSPPRRPGSSPGRCSV